VLTFQHLVGMSVVQGFEKYKKFNPSATAKDAAKALGIDAEVTEDKNPEGDGSADTFTGSTLNKRQSKTANRDRRAAGMAEAQAVKDAKAAEAAVPAKRKAEEELEDGQVPKAQDVEKGEVIEDENAELGDDFQEVIEGGRATKVRREE
jgi:tRNA acetyltransferase TAN1